MRNKKCLWLVDDLSSNLGSEEAKRWFAPDPLAKTLVTTRSRQYQALGTSVDLGVLTPEESYQLLTNHIKPVGEVEEEAARLLLTDLGHHSLAVDVAGGALKAAAGMWSFAGFRDLLRQESSDILKFASELGTDLPTGTEKYISKLLWVSISQLQDEGRDVLRLASQVAAAPIDLVFCALWFRVRSNSDDTSTQFKAIKGFNEAELASLADRAVENQTFTSISVHTLVSRAMRFFDDPSRLAETREAALHVIISMFEGFLSDPSAWPALDMVAPHADFLSRGPNADLSLLEHFAQYEIRRGAAQSAIVRLEEGIKVVPNLLPEAQIPFGLSVLKNTLASAVSSKFGPEAALPLNREVLDLRLEHLGEDHPATVLAKGNLATSLQAIGFELSLTPSGKEILSEVVTLQHEILAFHQKTEATSIELVTSLNNLGLSLLYLAKAPSAPMLSMGKKETVDTELLNESVSLLKEAISICKIEEKALQGTSGPNTFRLRRLAATESLGEVYLFMALPDRDRTLFDKGLNLLRRTLQELTHFVGIENHEVTETASGLKLQLSMGAFMFDNDMYKLEAHAVYEKYLHWLLAADPNELTHNQNNLRSELQILGSVFP